MKEKEVKAFVENFFKKHNYKVANEVYVHGYRIDLLAEKNERKYFVECKGDDYLRSHEIHVMVGQIVSEMHEVGPNIHYGLAMPYSLATYLSEFSIEGIRALKLHLFIVGQGEMWKGEVFYIDTEGSISFIQELKRNVKDAWFILFTLRKQKI